MDPRISFSYDFVVSQQAMKHENIYTEDPVSSDFEFSVKNNSMISADEAFFQGVLLPLKSSDCSRKVTLRDELLANDEYEEELPRLPKSSSRWKERLGLRRVSSKKDKNKNDGFPQRVGTEKGFTSGQGDKTVT
ncbi:uncharacterized protein LOC114177186 [Vigna unguiculata]|uniref:Uncharacterized protein n=1 Tax=Vigna unguiculata TaxID=3917 RepID=A0A4D6L441_VIGUN|nr:uncharacterized protein LOC114177186 [Vigna unguiculata]XP_027918244.1 uncharacterized protein LOC114177186 [Vigna unguiculata]QCD83194.1 hypothetical protein DEO72_LG2g3537 [Vigna unguiculata]